MRTLLLRHLRRAIVMPVGHLSAADVAAFIDRTLPPAARESAELHLSGCAQCREEVTEAARLAATVPARPVRRSPWLWLGVAAAAGIIAIVVRPRTNSRESGAATERGAPSMGRLRVYAPANATTLQRANLRFTWSREPANTNYRILVGDVTGAPAWSIDLADTSVAPPATARLISGQYFWRVEALHADGTVATSEQRSFTIAP